MQRERPPFALIVFAACEAAAIGAALPAGDPTLNNPALWVLAAVAWPALLLRRSRIAWYLAVCFTLFFAGAPLLLTTGLNPAGVIFSLAFAAGLITLLTPGMRSWVFAASTAPSASAPGLVSR